LTGSKAQWLFDVSHTFARSFHFVIPAFLVLLVVLELAIPAWPRRRRPVVVITTVLIHTTVLFGLAAIYTLVLIAAPVLTRTK
jgi:hypothetical protein